MGSLDKIKPETSAYSRFIDQESEIVISEKLDGVSILLEKKDNTIRCYTRGNGREGSDITKLLYSSLLDKTLFPNLDGISDLLVRGEPYPS